MPAFKDFCVSEDILEHYFVQLERHCYIIQLQMVECCYQFYLVA